MNRSTVYLALSRAKAIPGDIRAIIKGTKIDTGTYLDSLKGMEAEVPPFSPMPTSRDEPSPDRRGLFRFNSAPSPQ